MKQLILIMLLSQTLAFAQSYSIPGNTGYAVPMEKEEETFQRPTGSLSDVLQWKDPKQTIHYFFHVDEPGTADLFVEVRCERTAAPIRWSCNGRSGSIAEAGVGDHVLKAGNVAFKTPGFYELIFAASDKHQERFPDIKRVVLKGAIATSITTNQKSRRNAASVHLRYPIQDSVKAVGFYSELTIPKGADHLHSYYMACGFSRGYFGIQVNSEQERRVIFSVWDNGNEAVDRAKVRRDDLVQLIGKGDGVYAGDFGNEGTGGHSHWVYDWKPDVTYRFYVTALTDSEDTYYSGYFFIPEKQQWKLIAAYKAPKDGGYLRGLYSFNENFVGSNGQLQRKALFGEQWIQTEDRKWKELNTAIFSTDATGKAGDRKDIDAGVEAGRFFLRNGGFISGTAKPGHYLSRPKSKVEPVVDLYRDADSLATAMKEVTIIKEAISKHQIDTTGSIGGLYYQILKEGSGNPIRLTDTVTAFYKGWILNGAVFDQTKTEPATFPLARLIKGWQIGLPVCKVGGKVRLIIPSALAYSIRTRSAKIPPNSILVFDIEVVNVK